MLRYKECVTLIPMHSHFASGALSHCSASANYYIDLATLKENGFASFITKMIYSKLLMPSKHAKTSGTI